MTRPAPCDGLVGKLVAGRYQVVRRIGKGGMGTIYEVSHTRLQRRFAMKVLAADLTTDDEAVARFHREADVVSRFRHPNIVDIVDWDHLPDGSPCIVMEYLEGRDLATRIKQSGPLPWHELHSVADQLLSALESAHAAGIVHRDLKPQNVFLATNDAGEQVVKLLDFGISKVHDANSGLTATKQMLGTPAYMAPEQVAGESHHMGTWTDVWAAGGILFEMAAGRPAFEAHNVPSLLYKVCHGTPGDITAYRTDAPPAFVELVSRALSRDRARRLARVEQLREGLIAALGPLPRATTSADATVSRPQDAKLAVAETEYALGVAPLSTLSAATGVSLKTTTMPQPVAAWGRPMRLVALATIVVAVGAIVWAVGRSADRIKPTVVAAHPDPNTGTPAGAQPARVSEPRATAMPMDTAPTDAGPELGTAEPGYLTLWTDPAAQIWIDGVDTRKTTPLATDRRLVLEPGDHQVGFVVGTQQFEFPVTIKSGTETEISERLPVAKREPPQRKQRKAKTSSKKTRKKRAAKPAPLIALHVDSKPEGATVMHGKRVLGTSPLRTTIQRPKRARIRLTLKLKNYVTQKVTIPIPEGADEVRKSVRLEIDRSAAFDL